MNDGNSLRLIFTVHPPSVPQWVDRTAPPSAFAFDGDSLSQTAVQAGNRNRYQTAKLHVCSHRHCRRSSDISNYVER
ncbi:hypothetical protein ACLOJK_039916 [Asimina triloba]